MFLDWIESCRLPRHAQISKMKIVNQARSWLGTKFHHQGRIKINGKNKGGCDCIGLVVGVASELDLKSRDNGKCLIDFDRAGYAKMPDGKLLKDELDRHLIPVAVDEVQPGDLLLFKFEKEPQHVGIVSDYKGLGIIHCYAQAREVVEHRLDEIWINRIVGAYRFFRE